MKLKDILEIINPTSVNTGVKGGFLRNYIICDYCGYYNMGAEFGDECDKCNKTLKREDEDESQG